MSDEEREQKDEPSDKDAAAEAARDEASHTDGTASKDDEAADLDARVDQRIAGLLRSDPPSSGKKKSKTSKAYKTPKAVKISPKVKEEERRAGLRGQEEWPADQVHDDIEGGWLPGKQDAPPADTEWKPVRDTKTARFEENRAQASSAQVDAIEEALAESAEPVSDGERSGKEAREFMKAIQRQQRLRRQSEIEEAKRLQEQARDLMRKQRKADKRDTQLQAHADWVRKMASELGFDPERPITEVPPVPEGFEQVEFHTMRKGRSYIRILYDLKTNSYLYEVIEPRLTTTEKDVMAFLRDTLIRTMDGRQGRMVDDWEEVLHHQIQQAILDHSILIDEVSSQRIQYHLVRDFLGYGPIDPLMLDPLLEDISCDGPGIPIYVFHRTYESIKTTIVFKDDDDLDSFVIRLAQRSGKHISIAEPLLDATLPDGSRLQTTLSREVTTRGSSFTIRKFRADPFTPPDLVKFGTMDPRMAAFFWMVIEHGFSLIMAGGTASGKTTTLNAVCQFIPPERKVVSIEDTREINLNHENWIAGVTRSGFGGQMIGDKPAGAIDMYKLLEAALRQRPEYLMVGEVRGKEALTLFQAMATGHTVYSTMHADSVPSAVYRLENPPISVPRLMLQTLDLMAIQGAVRTGDRMVRRILDVTEIVGFDPDTRELLTNSVFRFDARKGEHEYLGKSAILEHIMEKRNLDDEQMEAEWQNRMKTLEWLVQHSIRDYRDVSRIITMYYQHPERLMEQLFDPDVSVDDLMSAIEKDLVAEADAQRTRDAQDARDEAERAEGEPGPHAEGDGPGDEDQVVTVETKED